jgi:hypothetical protein
MYNPTYSKEYCEMNENQVKIIDIHNFFTAYYNKTSNKVTIYTGRKTKKPVVYFTKSEDEAIDIINKKLAIVQEKKDYKDQQRAQKKEKASEIRENIKIGDIFYTSWGYSMTIVEFFQVTKIVKKKVEIKRIAQTVKNDNYMSGYCSPVKDDFISESKLCSVNAYGIVKADDYGNIAYPTENRTEFYFNRMD